MSIVVRPSLPSDIPTITAIYAHAVRHGTATFEIEPPDEAEMAARHRALIEGGFPYFVAEIDGVPAAFAYAGPYRLRPAYRFSVEDSIYVAVERHRRGIGRMLLSRLIAEAEARGFRQMIAVIGDSQQAASIALHRSAGFEYVGTLKSVGFKFDRWLDSVLMQRPLEPGATRPP
jgi:L-amino acid N-acyltransferase YncA